MVANQSADVVAPQHIAGGGGVVHRGVGGIANQATHVHTIVDVIDGTDIAGGAGVVDAAATARVADQATNVVVLANHIAGGADIGQRAMVVADEAAHGAFGTRGVGGGRTIGQGQIGRVTDQTAVVRIGGIDGHRCRRGVGEVDVVNLANQTTRIAAGASDIARGCPVGRLYRATRPRYVPNQTARIGARCHIAAGAQVDGGRRSDQGRLCIGLAADGQVTDQATTPGPALIDLQVGVQAEDRSATDVAGHTA